jgi:hypothetical protein
MTNLIWKLLPKTPFMQTQVVWRKLEDGREESCSVEALEYLKWLEEGNTPLPADE